MASIDVGIFQAVCDNEMENEMKDLFIGPPHSFFIAALLPHYYTFSLPEFSSSLPLLLVRSKIVKEDAAAVAQTSSTLKRLS